MAGAPLKLVVLALFTNGLLSMNRPLSSVGLWEVSAGLSVLKTINVLFLLARWVKSLSKALPSFANI